MFWAVQQDAVADCVDWQVYHAWREDDPNFSGAIIVLNEQGAQSAAAWSIPTDAGADIAPTGIGWRRSGPWSPDGLGRRTAGIDRSAAPLPAEWQKRQ